MKSKKLTGDRVTSPSLPLRSSPDQTMWTGTSKARSQGVHKPAHSGGWGQPRTPGSMSNCGCFPFIPLKTFKATQNLQRWSLGDTEPPIAPAGQPSDDKHTFLSTNIGLSWAWSREQPDLSSASSCKFLHGPSSSTPCFLRRRNYRTQGPRGMSEWDLRIFLTSSTAPLLTVWTPNRICMTTTFLHWTTGDRRGHTVPAGYNIRLPRQKRKPESSRALISLHLKTGN